MPRRLWQTPNLTQFWYTFCALNPTLETEVYLTLALTKGSSNYSYAINRVTIPSLTMVPYVDDCISFVESLTREIHIFFSFYGHFENLQIGQIMLRNKQLENNPRVNITNSEIHDMSLLCKKQAYIISAPISCGNCEFKI